MHTYQVHIDEIFAWGWIAATVLVLLMFAAALSLGTDTSPLLRAFDLAVSAMEQTSLSPELPY
jgi:hypothetical protein